MVTKVIKRDNSTQAYNESKIVKACVGAKVPEPIAQAIAKMVTAEFKSKDSVKSLDIKKFILDIIDKTCKASKNWIEYKKK